MARRRRPCVLLGMVLAVLPVTLAACRTHPDGAVLPEGQRSWAPLPEEVPIPAAAPDDPAAYRGVRFRSEGQTPGVRCCEGRVQGAPWLRAFDSEYVIAVEPGRPVFAFRQMSDGRRRMVWFVREVEPASPPPGQRPLSAQKPLQGVLDVLVLPGEPEEGLGVGCGPDRVFMYYEDAWRLNATTGRIEPVDPDNAKCDD